MIRMSQTDVGTSRSGIQSIEIGMRVIETLVQASGALPLRDIAKGAGLAPSAAHRYAVSFTRAGLIVQHDDQRYDLGPLAVRLGFAALSRVDPIQMAISRLKAFVAETGTTAMLSVWSERGPLVVRWLQGSPPVYTTIAVGSVMPVSTSATGRVFLGWLPELAVPLAPKGTDCDVMSADIRKTGFAEISGDLVPGLFAFAVPVFDGTSALVAVMTAVAAGEPLADRTKTTLWTAANETSKTLGYRSGADI
jgi:DNA-binding IclR family transcriptional regulator